MSMGGHQSAAMLKDEWLTTQETRKRERLPYGSMNGVCPTVKRLWHFRDDEPPLCEPFGLRSDFIDNAEQERQAEIRSVVLALMECLTEREKTLIAYRYEHDMTLEECGRVFEVTRERIRQIENLAFRKMRRHSGVLGEAAC